MRARSQRLKQAARSLPGEPVSREFAGRGALEGYPSHYTSSLIKFEEWLIRTEYYIVKGIWDVSVFHVSCSKHRQMGCAQKICELLVNNLSKQWVKVYSDYSYPFVSESNQVTLMDTSQCHLPLNLVIILVFHVHLHISASTKANEGLKFLLELRHFFSTSAWGHSLQDKTPSGDAARKGYSVFIHKPGTSTLQVRWLYLCAFITWSLATASKRCPNRICTGGLLWSNVGQFNRATAVGAVTYGHERGGCEELLSHDMPVSVGSLTPYCGFYEGILFLRIPDERWKLLKTIVITESIGITSMAWKKDI